LLANLRDGTLGLENKILIVPAVSLSEAGQPIHAKITPVAGLSFEAVSSWPRDNLTRCCAMLSDGLAWFRSVTMAGCSHEAIVTIGKHPSFLPQLHWINILLGNLRTSLSGTFHASIFDKYARRYLGGYCFRFNRRFSLAAMAERIANAVCCCMPCSERNLRVVEAY